MELFDVITDLKGVGPKKAAALKKLNIHTLEDLLFFFPRDYEDRRACSAIGDLKEGSAFLIRGTVDLVVKDKYRYGGKQRLRVLVSDDTGSLEVVFFHAVYLKDKFRTGSEWVFYGKVSRNFGKLQMLQPEFCDIEEESGFRGIVPVYPLSQGLSQKDMRKWQQQIRSLCREAKDAIPQKLIKENRLCSMEYALQNIHFPTDRESAQLARNRLVFEELLMLSLSLHSVRSDTSTCTGFVCAQTDLTPFLEQLPFQLTGAQQRAIAQVSADLNRSVPMNRLVQGDVGSGKTMVAAAAAFLAYQNGYMSALMAPTEILAQQHYQGLSKLLGPLGMRLGLLCGSMTAKEKRQVKESIALGMVDLVIGTHALLSRDVDLPNLALVITDEQHRFGVRQRAMLGEKSVHPHTLVMSATPIPRTLALMIYGDLDVSSIDELPPNRQPVKTYVISSKLKLRAYRFLQDHLDRGLQGYIVCPLVEEMEDTPSNLQNAQEYADTLARGPFQGYQVGVLHGKMRPKEREAIMSAFARGEIQLLVSTTVIEVGVDVPNAVIMMVENAERFGLSQLHQLRGRVGRGSEQSYCILVSDNRNPDTRERLEMLHRTNDGFKVAEYDLKVRGPGDFLGKRQHGLPQLKIADLGSSMEMMEQVQQAAELLLEPNRCSEAERNLLDEAIRRTLQTVGDSLN